MADTIKIGNLDISYFKVGGSNCSIYLGDTKLYPNKPSLPYAFKRVLRNGSVYTINCSASSADTVTLAQAKSGLTNSNLSGSTENAKNPLEVTFGDCSISIDSQVCMSWSWLSSITISDSVTSIGDSAFYDCTSLTSIDIPDSVTSIGDSAFRNCSSLTSIVIPSGITSINDRICQFCTSLESVYIPSGVTSIGGYAFSNCTSLTSTTLPSGITSIADGVFNYASGLRSVTCLATTPPTLGSNVFKNTNNCPIYVPSASVDAYKAATNWSTYASRIQAIPT